MSWKLHRSRSSEWPIGSVLLAGVWWLAACAAPPESVVGETPAAGDTEEFVAAAVPDERPTVVFLGDSLTAGYGLSEELAFPALLEDRLAAEGLPTRVVNAGVSGDTTAGGLARLDWLLQQEPRALVVALGANDGLRALPLAVTEANLRAIVERARDEDIEVLLVGMRMPPNYGERFTAGYEALFARVARDEGVPFVPFLLEGVAADPGLNQADGIHPTADGQERIADHLAPAVIALRRALDP